MTYVIKESTSVSRTQKHSKVKGLTFLNKIHNLQHGRAGVENDIRQLSDMLDTW
jgi:hypothetical protein